MKKLFINFYRRFINIYRLIVGTEYGFTGEGNEQWYYFLSLVINLMLIWWLKPEIVLLFTILAVIHYLTIFIYGHFMLSFYSINFSYAYIGIHIILLAIAIIANFKWAIFTMAITTIAYYLAPDSTGNNVFLCKPNVNNQLPLLFNTIIFVAFVVVDFLLPINLWVKLLFIISALVIHPVIDLFEGDCVIISDVTHDVTYMVLERIRKHEEK